MPAAAQAGFGAPPQARSRLRSKSAGMIGGLFEQQASSGGAPYRPGGPPAYGSPTPSFNDFVPMDDRGRPFKNKGSRRNIRRRKRGFD